MMFDKNISFGGTASHFNILCYIEDKVNPGAYLEAEMPLSSICYLAHGPENTSLVVLNNGERIGVNLPRAELKQKLEGADASGIVDLRAETGEAAHVVDLKKIFDAAVTAKRTDGNFNIIFYGFSYHHSTKRMIEIASEDVSNLKKSDTHPGCSIFVRKAGNEYVYLELDTDFLDQLYTHAVVTKAVTLDLRPFTDPEGEYYSLRKDLSRMKPAYTKILSPKDNKR